MSGFTLIEFIIALAIGAIVLCIATPSFSAMLEKQRLDGAASRLISDVQLARTQAAARGESVRISVHGTHGGCYLVHTGTTSACTCTDTGASTCGGGAEALKTVGFGTDASLRLRLEAVSQSLVFNPIHGTTSPTGTFTLTAASGRSLRQAINLMGRVRTCSPSVNAPAVAGYAVC